MLQINDQEHHQCLDCGTDLQGDFCPNCGQERIRPYDSFWYLIRETLSNTINFDSRLFQTLKPLMFSPGKLSSEYSGGRRTRYIHPIRLYIFTSLVVFVLLSLLNNMSNDNPNVSFSFNGIDSDGDIRIEPDTGRVTMPDSLYLVNRQYPIFSTEDDYQHYLDTVSAENRPGWVARAMLRQAMKLQGASNEELVSHFRSTFAGTIPRSLFILIPVFALLLKLLLPGKRFYYEEHIVFGLHFHTFLFLAIFILVLLGKLSILFWILFPVWATWYFWRSMQVQYKLSGGGLVWRSLTVMILYGVVIVCTSALLVVLTFLLL